jgi:hypothetical protein
VFRIRVVLSDDSGDSGDDSTSGGIVNLGKCFVSQPRERDIQRNRRQQLVIRNFTTILQ